MATLGLVVYLFWKSTSKDREGLKMLRNLLLPGSFMVIFWLFNLPKRKEDGDRPFLTQMAIYITVAIAAASLMSRIETVVSDQLHAHLEIDQQFSELKQMAAQCRQLADQAMQLADQAATQRVEPNTNPEPP